MRNPIIVAAAFAAGLSSFAMSMEASAASSPRADKGALAVPSQDPEKKPAKLAKKKPAKAAKVASAAESSACPYVFGCADDAKGKADEVKVNAKPRPKKLKASAVRSKAEVSPKNKKVRRKPSPEVDSVQTSAIAPSASGRSPYSDIIARYAASYGVPVSLAHAVIRVESNYRPNVTGSAGEIGLMQIKPSTARMLGYTGSAKGLYHPETNIKFGMKYLAMARDLSDGTTCGTILKYNAGHAAKRMNPVSSAYCRKVKVEMASLGSPA